MNLGAAPNRRRPGRIAAANHAERIANVANPESPSEQQLQAFVTRLRQFRETLGDSDRLLLDALYCAGTGRQPDGSPDVTAYWSSPASTQVGWVKTPWGVAFNGFQQYDSARPS